MAKNDFQYGGLNSYTLQCAMWHDHDIYFVRWLHPAMWHVALESWQWIHQVAGWQHPAMWYMALAWHEIWIRPNVRHIRILQLVSISTHHRSRHVILYQSAKFYPNRTTLGEKMTSCRFSWWRMSAILDCRDPIMGSLKSPVKLT